MKNVKSWNINIFNKRINIFTYISETNLKLSTFYSCIYSVSKTTLTFLEDIRVIGLNATFNNFSAISWRSDLLVEETGVPGENHRPAASHWQISSHNVVSSTPRLSVHFLNMKERETILMNNNTFLRRWTIAHYI